MGVENFYFLFLLIPLGVIMYFLFKKRKSASDNRNRIIPIDDDDDIRDIFDQANHENISERSNHEYNDIFEDDDEIREGNIHNDAQQQLYQSYMNKPGYYRFWNPQNIDNSEYDRKLHHWVPETDKQIKQKRENKQYTLKELRKLLNESYE